MKILKKLLRRNREKSKIDSGEAVLKSRSGIIDEMYGKDEDCVNGEVLKVVYSRDKCKRFIVFSSDKGYVSYIFEKLHISDEEEILYFGRACYWEPTGCNGSVYTDFDEAMEQLVFEPEYKKYFSEEGE